VTPKRRPQQLLAASHVQKSSRTPICRLLLSVAAVGVVAMEGVISTSHFNY
jgi:hypothetical protein